MNAPSMTSHQGAAAGSRKASNKPELTAVKSSTESSRPMAFWQSASVSTAVATHRAMTRAAGRPQFHMDMMIAGARPASIYRLVWRMVRPQCQ